MNRKIFLIIHRWLGIICGLVVFVVGLTGAIYAFEKELRAIIYNDLYEIAPGNQKLPTDSLVSIAERVLGSKYPISTIRIDESEGKSVEVNSWKFNPKANTYWNNVIYSRAVYIHPYSGEVIGNVNVKWEFFTVVLAMHRTLLLGHAGSLIVGWSTVVFIILLITGLVLWYPRNKAAARQRFWFRWKNSTTFKRKNYDLHNISGFYAFLFLLIIALTGLIWSFDWWEETVQKTVDLGKTVEKEPPVFSDTTQVLGRIPMTEITKQISSNAFNRKKYFVVVPKLQSGTVNAVVPGEGRHRYTFIQLYFDRYSGKLIKRGPYFHEKSAGEQLRNMNIDIHTGSVLGLPGKILACLLSLVAAALPITGFIIWWNKNKKTKRGIVRNNIRVAIAEG